MTLFSSRTFQSSSSIARFCTSDKNVKLDTARYLSCLGQDPAFDRSMDKSSLSMKQKCFQQNIYQLSFYEMSSKYLGGLCLWYINCIQKTKGYLCFCDYLLQPLIDICSEYERATRIILGRVSKSAKKTGMEVKVRLTPYPRDLFWEKVKKWRGQVSIRQRVGQCWIFIKLSITLKSLPWFPSHEAIWFLYYSLLRWEVTETTAAPDDSGLTRCHLCSTLLFWCLRFTIEALCHCELSLMIISLFASVQSSEGSELK